MRQSTQVSARLPQVKALPNLLLRPLPPPVKRLPFQVCLSPPPNLLLLTLDLESTSSSDFRPTRRVRTAPGGETHDIFGHYVDDDALASAPPRDVPAAAATTEPAHTRYAALPSTFRVAGTNHSDEGRIRALSGMRITVTLSGALGQHEGVPSFVMI